MEFSSHGNDANVAGSKNVDTMSELSSVPNSDLRRFIDTEGSINYGAKDPFGRPTGINAVITPNTPRGTPPSGGKTPGFSRAQGHTRGHLLGAQLGGTGSDARNLVTQFPAANANAMSKIEDAVKWKLILVMLLNIRLLQFIGLKYLFLIERKILHLVPNLDIIRKI